MVFWDRQQKFDSSKEENKKLELVKNIYHRKLWQLLTDDGVTLLKQLVSNAVTVLKQLLRKLWHFLSDAVTLCDAVVTNAVLTQTASGRPMASKAVGLP